MKKSQENSRKREKKERMSLLVEEEDTMKTRNARDARRDKREIKQRPSDRSVYGRLGRELDRRMRRGALVIKDERVHNV